MITTMPPMHEALSADLNAPHYIRPGVLVPPASCHSRRALKTHYAGGGPVFVSAGHADARKGFDRFLTAAAEITARAPDARFIWLGAETAWSRPLTEEARAKGVTLDMPGFVGEMMAWYGAADAYLLTSRQDPGPTTLVHALTAGLPFVGYDSDIGLREFVLPYGAFIPEDDAALFADTALRLVAESTRPARRAQRQETRRRASFDTFFKEISAGL